MFASVHPGCPPKMLSGSSRNCSTRMTSRSVTRLKSTRASVNNTTEWGTDQASALDLIQDALNLKTPTIYQKISLPGESEKFVVNAAATEGAREKQEKIKERFKEW